MKIQTQIKISKIANGYILENPLLERNISNMKFFIYNTLEELFADITSIFNPIIEADENGIPEGDDW